MKTYYSDQIDFPVSPDHSFPIEKHTRLRNNLLERGILANQDLYIPEPSHDEEIQLAHRSLFQTGDQRFAQRAGNPAH